MATDVKPNAFARFGNDLHSGARSYPFVGKRRLWLALAALLMAVSVLIPAVGGGFNLGIDFRGGSEFVVSKTAHVDVATGERVIHEKAKDASEVHVTNIAPGTIRAQMSKLSDDETLQVKKALQEAYGVSENDVTSSFVGPTWGADVTRQAFWGSCGVRDPGPGGYGLLLPHLEDVVGFDCGSVLHRGGDGWPVRGVRLRDYSECNYWLPDDSGATRCTTRWWCSIRFARTRTACWNAATRPLPSRLTWP